MELSNQDNILDDEVGFIFYCFSPNVAFNIIRLHVSPLNDGSPK